MNNKGNFVPVKVIVRSKYTELNFVNNEFDYKNNIINYYGSVTLYQDPMLIHSTDPLMDKFNINISSEYYLENGIDVDRPYAHMDLLDTTFNYFRLTVDGFIEKDKYFKYEIVLDLGPNSNLNVHTFKVDRFGSNLLLGDKPPNIKVVQSEDNNNNVTKCEFYLNLFEDDARNICIVVEKV